MATNNEGSWSNVLVRYPFTVKAPFYQTAGFVFSVIAGSVLFLLFIFYWRMRQRVEQTLLLERIREQEQENLRKEIARDFHDEMGNQLTRIINYVSLLRLNGSIVHPNGNGATSKIDLYTKVEDSAKYLYSGTRDFIWSIDPVNDELSKLFIHIRDFGEKLFEEKGIQFRAYNEVKGKVKLPYGFSREANLIFKEAMTNTFKSAQAKNATFSLQKTASGFEFTFTDDGVGFQVAEIENSNGLKNIRARAEKLGAVLRLQSKPGEGTTVTLHFKLTKSKKYGATI
jgi:signal transduction histidine kinase